MTLQDSLDALRGVAATPTAEPEPVEGLLALAKTMTGSGPEVAKTAERDELERRERAMKQRIDQREAEVNRRLTEAGSLILRSVVLTQTPGDALEAVEKAERGSAREEPPGLHHVRVPDMCQTCRHRNERLCTLYDWPVDPDETCESYSRLPAVWSPLAHKPANAVA